MLEEIRKADGLIIGSPNYLGDVSAAFRSLYERLIFQYITYNTEAQSYNDHRIPVLLIMTSNTPDDSNIELMNKYKAVLDSGKTILPFCTSYLTQFYHIRSMYARKKKSDIIKSTNLYMVWRFQ